MPWQTELDISLPEADYVSPGGLRFKFEVRIQIVPVVSRTKPTWLKASVLFPYFLLENTTFTDVVRLGAFPKGTVLDRVLSNPDLVKAAAKYPNISRFWIEYRREGGYRWIREEQWLESGFDVLIDLERAEGYKAWGMSFNYFAKSGLDPLVSWPGGKVKPGPFVPSDTIEEPSLRQTPEEPKEPSLFGAGFQQVIYRLPERDWPEPPKSAKAYSVADLKSLPSNTKSLELEGYSWRPGDLKPLARFTHMKRLDLSQLRPDPNKPFPIEELRIVARFKHLRSISAPEYGSNDDFVSRLVKLRSLEEMNLNSSSLSDKGLAKLVRLPKLTDLDLRWCKHLTDRSFNSFSKMRQLRKLDIAYSGNFSDSGISRLKALPNLRELSIGGLKRATPKGLKALDHLLNLKRLSMGDMAVDSSTIRSISKLSKLASLDFDNVRGLDDQLILALSNLKTIEWLSFLQCKGVTAEGAERLRLSLPGKFAMNK